MRAEPVVNRLREELDGRLMILQLNVHDAPNEEVLEELNAQFTPTFVLFDQGGQEVWRTVGTLDPDLVRQLVEAQ